MKDRELFNACVRKCVWCAEQWPIVAGRGSMLHVGPFTKDPKLFSIVCKAGQIREAFEYVGYRGGKQVKHKLPTIKRLLALEAPRVVTSPGNRSFWRTGIVATLEVSEWPEWKLSEGSLKSTSEELKECREELFRYDAMDWHARQPCTEGHQFYPGYKDKRFATPTCNGGLGCATCWGKYEQFYEQEAKNWCY